MVRDGRQRLWVGRWVERSVSVSVQYAPSQTMDGNVGDRAFRPLVSRVRVRTEIVRRSPHLPTQPRFTPRRQGAGPAARRRHRERHRAATLRDGDAPAVDPEGATGLRRRVEAVADPLAELGGELPQVGGRVPAPADDQRGLAAARRRAARAVTAAPQLVAVPAPARGGLGRAAAARAREQLARLELPEHAARGALPARPERPPARRPHRHGGSTPQPLLRVHDLLGRGRRP